MITKQGKVYYEMMEVLVENHANAIKLLGSGASEILQIDDWDLETNEVTNFARLKRIEADVFAYKPCKEESWKIINGGNLVKGILFDLYKQNMANLAEYLMEDYEENDN